MRGIRIALFAGTLLAMSEPTYAEGTPAPATALPHIAVYRWALHTENVDAFGQWIGHPEVWGEDFTDNSSWDKALFGKHE